MLQPAAVHTRPHAGNVPEHSRIDCMGERGFGFHSIDWTLPSLGVFGYNATTNANYKNQTDSSINNSHYENLTEALTENMIHFQGLF